jgi:hypothetical protein
MTLDGAAVAVTPKGGLGDPGDVFERFTDRARSVVVLAQEESRLLSHNYIGTEHLLLGLVRDGEGVAAQALGSLDVSLEAVRAQVVEIIGYGGSAPSGHIPFTPRAKKVLEQSLREALQLGHNYIGTEHILLGLVREGEGVAAQVLVKLGADLSRVRQQVIQLLSGGADAMLHLEPETTASPVPVVGSMPGSSFGGGSRRCWFCGRSEESVNHLVRAREAYICDACIALAHEAASTAPPTKTSSAYDPAHLFRRIVMRPRTRSCAPSTPYMEATRPTKSGARRLKAARTSARPFAKQSSAGHGQPASISRSTRYCSSRRMKPKCGSFCYFPRDR